MLNASNNDDDNDGVNYKLVVVVVPSRLLIFSNALISKNLFLTLDKEHILLIATSTNADTTGSSVSVKFTNV